MPITAGDVVGAVSALVADSQFVDVREESFSWVGWGNEIKLRGNIPGVFVLSIQPDSDEGNWITVTIDSGVKSDFSNLGYAYLPRDRGRSSMNNFHGPRRFVWDLTYGYVNGYPKRDILYYLLTRVLRKFKNTKGAR